jgi:hypothetical protein
MTNHVKPLISVILLCAGVATALPVTSVADVYVISNPTATVSAGDIKDIFLGEKQLSGSTKLAPVDNSAAQTEFLAKVMQLDSVKYDSLWTKKSFRDGVNPPVLKASDADVINAVKASPGGVGYITSAPPPGVTVVKKF